MSTRTILSTVGRLVLGAAACVISLASCGGEMLRTGRVAGVPRRRRHGRRRRAAAASASAFLLSDVQTLVDQTVDGVTTQGADDLQ